MKINDNNKFLKFGDLITIMGTSSHPKHQDIQGFLSAVGFTDRRVFFQKVPSSSLQKAIKQAFTIGAKQSQEIQINPLNFIKNTNELVFQVWPRLNFDAHKEYRKALKERDQLKIPKINLPQSHNEEEDNIIDITVSKISKKNQVQPLLNDSKNNPNGVSDLTLLDNIELRLRELKKRIASEREQNISQLQNFIGETVSYGAEIQLLHYESKMFLNGKILASEAERSAYKFELSDQFSGGMLFRLIPKYKLRVLGEAIQFNDMIIIQNQKLNSFINFSAEMPIDLDRNQDEEFEESMLPVTDVKQNDYRTPRFETFLSLFSDTNWQIIKHGQEVPPNENLIRGGEIVRLRHTELNELMTGNIVYQLKEDKTQEFPEVHTRQYTGIYEEEKHNLGSLWQIELDTPFNRGAFIQCQAQDKTVFHFRLRHLVTGRLLGKATGEILGTERPIIALLKDDELIQNSAYDQATRINFIPTIDQGAAYIRSQQCYQLKIGKSFVKTVINPDYTLGKVLDPYVYYHIEEPIQLPYFYSQLSDNEMQVKRKILELTDKNSDQDAFWVERIDESLKTEIGEILSTVPTIYRFVLLLQEKKYDQFTTDYFRNIQKTLHQIIYYITNTPYYEQQPNDTPIPHRQRILKNCNLLDYLTLILYLPFANKYVRPKQIERANQELLRVFSMCYMVIKITIKEYRPNEVYMSQFLELMISQAMMYNPIKEDPNESVTLQFQQLASETLTELIDNNRFVLENKITSDIIKRFVNQLLDTRESKYLNLLRALINCGGEAMVGNQSEISKQLLKRKQQQDEEEEDEEEDEEELTKKANLIPEFKYDGHQVTVKILSEQIDEDDYEQDTQNFDVIELQALKKKRPEKYKYIVELIEFLSDLCLDKNFLAINPLQLTFPFDMCKYILMNNNYSKDIRSSFAQLILNLWVEGKQIQNLQLPNYIRTNEELNDEKLIDILSSRDDHQMFDSLKGFIIQHIKSENEKLFIRKFQTLENKFTQEILQICYSFLSKGFYVDIDELRELVKPLIDYLNSSNDVSSEEEEKLKIIDLKNQQRRFDFRKISKHALKANQSKYSSRYVEDDETKILVKSRTLICDILYYINNLTTDIRSTLFLREFKKNYRSESDTMKPSETIKKKKTFGLPIDININLGAFNPLKLFSQTQNISPELVPLTWINDILTQKNYDILEEFREHLVAILMDLLMYQDANLVAKAFKLMNELYSRKMSILIYLKDIQIIDDPNKMILLEDVRETKKSLQIHIDNSENWWGVDTESAKQNCKTVKSLTDFLKEIMIRGAEVHSKKQIEFHTPKISNNQIILDEKSFQEEKNEEDFLLIDKEEKKKRNVVHDHLEFQYGINSQTLLTQIKPEFQKMMRNLEIYKPLINLVNFDLQRKTELDETSNSTLLLKSVYQFLAYFCFNNPENQAILKSYAKQFRNHLNRNTDILAHLVLQEIYRNNRLYLMNPNKLLKATSRICELIEKAPKQNPLRIFLLDSLTIYMTVDGQVVKSNQTAIINLLGMHEDLLLLYNDEKEFNNFIEQAQDVADEFRQVCEDQDPESCEVKVKEQINQNNILKIPLEMNYLLVLLKVMSTAAEEKNAAAESRCQSYFPMKKLYKFLQGCKACWPLRKGIYQFFYDVYIDTEKELEDNENSSKFILEEIIQDLGYWSKEYNKVIQSPLQIVTFKQIIFIKDFLNELIDDILIPTLQIIVKANLLYSFKAIAPLFSSLIKIIYEYASCKEDSIITNFSKLLILIEGNKKISKQIKFAELKLNCPQIINSKIKQINATAETLEIKKKNKRLIPAIKDQGINGSLTQKLKKLRKHKTFNSETEKEIEQMVDLVTDIEKLTYIELQSSIITFDQILEQMVKLMDPKQDPLPVDLSLVGLKLFRKIIEKENESSVLPAADWTNEDFSIYAKKIEQTQDELVRLNMQEIVFDLISMETNIELKYEAILVGISLMVGGNTNAQNAFYELFQKDFKNHFIIAIKQLIESQFQLIKRFSDRRIKEREEDILNEEKKKLELASEKHIEIHHVDQQQNSTESYQYEMTAILNLKRIYRFLQLFCEGHNLNMQNYLRLQTQQGQNNGKSINLINHTSIKFGTILKGLCLENIDLVSQMIDFLIESVQGPCPDNQESMTTSKIVDFCSELIMMFTYDSEYLKRGFKSDDRDQVTTIVSKATKLLLSLIEGNTNTNISQFISANLELTFIKKRLVDVYRTFLTSTLNLSQIDPMYIVNKKTYEVVDFFTGTIADAFEMYLLIVSLADKLGKDSLPYQILTEEAEQIELSALEFYRKNTASVEIFFQERLVRVFFPVDPTCRNLSKDSRTKLMSTVKRDSPNDKLNGLLAASSILFSEMHHMSWLQKLPFHFTASRLDFFHDFSTLLALVINIILIAAMKRQIDFNTTSMIMDDFNGTTNTYVLIKILGIIQLATSSLMLTFWLVINTPIILTAQWSAQVEECKLEKNEQLENEIEDVNRDPTQYTTNQLQFLFRTKGPYSDYFYPGGKHTLGSMYGKILYYIKSFIFLCSDPQFIYMFFYIIVSIVAVIQSEILYCFHLLDIINRNEMLKNVVRAVTGNFKQLALTLFLMAIVIYIYTLIGFYFLGDNFYNKDIKEDLCSSVFYCYLTAIQYGLRNGGGIAESMKNISFAENYDTTYWSRFVYDVSFFSIITVIFLNIIFGIIIDTFAELRDEKNAMTEDMNSKCYICGLDRYQFEKNADGFMNHIDRDHDLWNYLHYIHYLENKDKTEYNGVESFVVEKMGKMEIDWFPIMKALSLGNDDDNESLGQKVIGQLNVLREDVLILNSKVTTLK